ncbi:steryl-sulfatase-like [Lampetra fluviatilis]
MDRHKRINGMDSLECEERHKVAQREPDGTRRRVAVQSSRTRSLGTMRIMLLGLVLLLMGPIGNADPHPRRPNFVLMMADDLGIGDVGCYGNHTIKTPNIDRLAQEGVKLTQHIAAASLCTPSRAAFLTGRYPVRSGMASRGSLRVFIFNANSGGLPTSEITFPKLLKEQGYSTAIIGKWHQGLNCDVAGDHCHHPLSHGFDYFYGMPMTNLRDCKQGEGSVIIAGSYKLVIHFATYSLPLLLALLLSHLAGLVRIPRIIWFTFGVVLMSVIGLVVFVMSHSRMLNCILMLNHEVIQQPIVFENLTQRIVSQAIGYIDRNRDGPFMLFLSFVHVHTALFAAKRFHGTSKHGFYGDNVHEMDWAVGEVVNHLEKLGLSDNTLVYFTSDQGGHLEEISDSGDVEGGWNGIYRGGKSMGGFDGGIRVPAILRWPGVLPASVQVDQPTSLMDIYPTVLSLAGASLPQGRVIDGKDLLPLLLGNQSYSEHEFLFHYCGTYLNAVRWVPRDSQLIWKVHFFSPVFSPAGSNGCYNTVICHCQGNFVQTHDPPLVFEMQSDPSESSPLAVTSAAVQAVLAVVQRAVSSHQQSLTPVPSQFSLNNLLWKPWLQPCCGFLPSCGCDNDVTLPHE